MSIVFEEHKLPTVLSKQVSISSDESNEILDQVKKSSRRLVKRMDAIERRERKIWSKHYQIY